MGLSASKTNPSDLCPQPLPADLPLPALSRTMDDTITAVAEVAAVAEGNTVGAEGTITALATLTSSAQVFGGRLYQLLREEEGNIIMSPFSVSGVMAMVRRPHALTPDARPGGGGRGRRDGGAGAAGHGLPRAGGARQGLQGRHSRPQVAGPQLLYKHSYNTTLNLHLRTPGG